MALLFLGSWELNLSAEQTKQIAWELLCSSLNLYVLHSDSFPMNIEGKTIIPEMIRPISYYSIVKHELTLSWFTSLSFTSPWFTCRLRLMVVSPTLPQYENMVTTWSASSITHRKKSRKQPVSWTTPSCLSTGHGTNAIMYSLSAMTYR